MPAVIETTDDTTAMQQEPLLQPSIKRLVIYPIEHNDIWEMYKRAEASFWTTEEIDIAADVEDFNTKLTESEQKYVKTVLAFFAASDGIVNENLAQNFAAEVQYPEARSFYGFQIAIENIHSETYSLMIETFVKDQAEKQKLLQAIDTMPSVMKKAEWALRWVDNGSFVERLVAFACVEGIFFSGAFCSIFWLKKRQLMLHGLGKSNELIARDEGLHRDFACLLYTRHIQNKLTDAEVHAIVRDAVEHEKEFVRDCLPVELLGMNSTLMCQYIEFVANHLVLSLGHASLYKVTNPFDWMEGISLESKSNMFEHRVTEYQKANVMTSVTGADGREFSLDADF